jgi:hypothetical protein
MVLTSRVHDVGGRSSGTGIGRGATESITATIKTELTKRQVWKMRLDPKLALVVHIGWYNQRTLHRAFKWRPPREVLHFGPIQF